MISVTRHHDFSAGHRVVDHEGSCKFLHGHNYRIHLTCVPSVGEKLDDLGRVVDFSVIKQKVCQWIDDHWDHKFMVWEQDPLLEKMDELPGFITVPFNPTAENIAKHLLYKVGPKLLAGTGVGLSKVTVEETRKCRATCRLN